MDVPAERIARLQRWFRRFVYVAIAGVAISIAQTAGWLVASAGLARLPLVDEAALAAALVRPPAAVMMAPNAAHTHTSWLRGDGFVRDTPLDARDLRAIARGLRAAGFERVLDPDDPLPDGVVAQYSASVTWVHPFVARTRQALDWGDPIAGSEIVIVTDRVWVLAGWWELEPEVTKMRWFDRENR